MKKNSRTLSVPNVIPDHVDPLRSLMAEARGSTFISFATLHEAAAHGAVLIMQGDDGGQIYLTYPASKVVCSEQALTKILELVDSKAWNDIDSADVRYEALKPGDGVSGGMGGGVVTDDLWIHPKLSALGLEKQIREALCGTVEL